MQCYNENNIKGIIFWVTVYYNYCNCMYIIIYLWLLFIATSLQINVIVSTKLGQISPILIAILLDVLGSGF